MPLNYGVLKGTVSGHKRDADDDHYQILVHAGTEVWRVASNVLSGATNAPSTVLYRMGLTLPDEFLTALRALKPGFKKLASKSGGLAIDYVRADFVKPALLKPLPADLPGDDNDLKDKLESAVVRAMEQDGAFVYAFGDRWGPEDKADQYFKFSPGNGVHDIHMNQGNSGKYTKDDGVYQDGALLFDYPDGKLRVFFFAFQSQDFDTDDKTGHSKNTPPPKDKSGKALKPKADKAAGNQQKKKPKKASGKTK